VAWVAPFERDADGNAVPPMAYLPRVRDPERRRRRDAAVTERRRREESAREATRKVRTGPSPFTEGQARVLAQAMLQPLRRRLDYASLGRKVFMVQQFGRRVGPYFKPDDGPWRREAPCEGCGEPWLRDLEDN